MANVDPAPTRSLGEKLQSFPREALYMTLLVLVSIPLFFPVKLPNKPIDPSMDFYANLMKVPDGSNVLLESDWTNSTRGESMGQMEAVLRILMRKHIKFVVYTIGDVQAPQVSRDTIRKVDAEEVKAGGTHYRPFIDYVNLGYYPNGEGTTNAINNNVLSVFSGKKDFPEGSPPRDVTQSPVIKGIKSITDFKYLIVITASSTNTVVLERITKVPVMMTVTGVMVPENTVYYAAGQLKGLIGGVKGVYDLETMMEVGLNNPGPHEIVYEKDPQPVPGFPGKPPYGSGKGSLYYPSLHIALFLLIFTVILGNVGMFLSKKRAK